MASVPEIIIYNIINIFLVYGAIIFQKIGAMNAPKFGEEKETTVFKKLLQNKMWLLGIALNAIAIPYSMFLLSISAFSFTMVFQRAGIILLIMFILLMIWLLPKLWRGIRRVLRFIGKSLASDKTDSTSGAPPGE